MARTSTCSGATKRGGAASSRWWRTTSRCRIPTAVRTTSRSTPSAVYEIHIDNNADAIEDITFQFRPSVLVKDLSVPVGNMLVPVPLINIGQIGPNAGDTSALNREESLRSEHHPRRSPERRGSGHHQRGRWRHDLSASPWTTSARSPSRNYATYANNHIYDIVIPGCDNGRMFVGQRKDSFVVNLGETFDLVNVTNPLGAENAEADDLADKNVTSFVLEVPIACLVSSASQPIIGGWTTASLGVGMPGGTPGPTPCPAGQPAALRPMDLPGLTWVPDQSCFGWVPSNHPAARGGPSGSAPPPAAPGTQVSRLGAPLVNEVVIGLRDKDLFNSASPTQDSALASYVTNPTLPGAARDPLRRRGRAGAEQLPTRRFGGGIPDRHPGPQPARRTSSRRRCCG